MNRLQALPACRRKALILAVASLVVLSVAGAAQTSHWPVHGQLLGLLTGLGLGGIVAAVLMWFLPDTSDAVPAALSRRYLREFLPAMAAYIGVMLVWKQLLAAVQMPLLRVLIALLPALLLLWIMRAFVRYVRDCDELQRRIELESGAAAALLVCAVYMAAGFLQTAELIDIPSKVAMLWVFPSLCVSYGVVKVFIARRYG